MEIDLCLRWCCHGLRMRWLTLSGVVLVLLVAPGRLDAQDRGVRVDGNLVIRVGASGGASPEARAQQVESRLMGLLERPNIDLEPIVRPDDGDPAARAIVVAGTTVVTVTADDAAANGVEVSRLTSQ